jgi:hypothetical protein
MEKIANGWWLEAKITSVKAWAEISANCRD